MREGKRETKGEWEWEREEDCRGISDQITFGSNLGLWVSALKLGDIFSFFSIPFRANSSKLILACKPFTLWHFKLYYKRNTCKIWIWHVVTVLGLEMFQFITFLWPKILQFFEILQKICLSFSLEHQTPNIIYAVAWKPSLRCVFTFCLMKFQFPRDF